MNEYYLFFDESGNLGDVGRYFVIAGILTENPKSLHNIMKKTLKQIKINYPNIEHDGYEIKAKNASKEVKEIVLGNISKKDVKILYIVADKVYMKPSLNKDKNLLYNYLLKILLDNYKYIFKGNKVNIILDNKSIKVSSKNSFSDYIYIYFNLELKLDVQFIVQYRDSKAADAYNIQAADYIANALFAYYEYGNKIYYDIIKSKFDCIESFPKQRFGEDFSAGSRESAAAADTK